MFGGLAPQEPTYRLLERPGIPVVSLTALTGNNAPVFNSIVCQRLCVLSVLPTCSRCAAPEDPPNFGVRLVFLVVHQ